MGPIFEKRQILTHLSNSIGEPNREQAFFWHLGLLGLGDDEPQNETIARLALAELISDEAEALESTTVRALIEACCLLWFVFHKPSLKLPNPPVRWPNPKKLPSLSAIPEDAPDLVRMQLHNNGAWKLTAKNRTGRIITDGVDQAVAGLPIKRCLHCDEIFAPSRRDTAYCRPSCRSSAGTTRHRTTKTKEL